MTDPTLEAVEDALEEAADLEADAALDLLAAARADLVRARDDPSVPDGRRRDLERRLEQRLREVGERDAYDGGFGAAMNPDGDDAP